MAWLVKVLPLFFYEGYNNGIKATPPTRLRPPTARKKHNEIFGGLRIKVYLCARMAQGRVALHQF